MNGKMQNQDQLKLKHEVNSNQGIQSMKKTPTKNFDSFTSSPLKKNAYQHRNFNSGSLDPISSLIPLKQQEQFLLESYSQSQEEIEEEEEMNNTLEESSDSKDNNVVVDASKAENSNFKVASAISNNVNFSKQMSSNLADLANLELSLNYNFKSGSYLSKTENINNYDGNNKEKKYSAANVNASENFNFFKLNSFKLNSNNNNNNQNSSLLSSAYKTTSSNLTYSANLNTTSYTNNNKQTKETKEITKEKAEDAAPLTSNLKNFLENYDDLLGMIGSNSKSNTMTSNFSQPQSENNFNNTNQNPNINNNNNNQIYTSFLENNFPNSLIKQDAKSKTLKLPQGTSHPGTFPNYSIAAANDENFAKKDEKKFTFASSFKNKKSDEMLKNNNRKSTGECFQTCSISLKKTVSDVAVSQSKLLRSKYPESGSLFRLNPVATIIEEDKKIRKSKNNVEDGKNKDRKEKKDKKIEKNKKELKAKFSIVPKSVYSDEENRNGKVFFIEKSESNSNEDEDFDNHDRDDLVIVGTGFTAAKKIEFGELQQEKDDKENSKDSFITLNPIVAVNPNKNTNIDNLITSQIRKPTMQVNQAEDRNVEETKLVQNLTNQEDIKDFYEYTEECLKRIIKLITPSFEEIQDLLFDLPFEDELKSKKLAIFDLDETLIHCEIKKPQKGQVQIMVNLPSGDTAKIGLNIRSFWKECLQELSKYYLIIVYTASHQSYADSVLDYLDPYKELIKYRLYRHNCVRVKMENEFIYVKDLRIFKNVKMEDMIIIDNSVLSFAFQLENGIPILPFYDNKEDIELKFLANYLGNIYNVKDLRVENNRSIKMLYFLNAIKEKEKSEEANNFESSSGDFNINLIKSNNDEYNNNNNNNNNSSNVSDPESLSASTGKKELNTQQESNSMFKISLFSAEVNSTNNNGSYASNVNNSNNNNNNQHDVSQMSDNNEISFSNSETSSHNDSCNYNSVDITNRYFSNNSYSNSSRAKMNFKGDKNYKYNHNNNNNNNNYDDKNLQNEKSEGSNIDSNGKKVSKRNNTFQENLFSTLDDLKKTFTKLSEKKRISCLSNNNNHA